MNLITVLPRTPAKPHRISRLGLALLVFLSISSFASDAASISGTLVDPSGAIVQPAVVLISNLKTGLQETSATDAQGSYVFPSLPAGRYRGIACFGCFASYMAEVVEITMEKDQPRVQRVVAVSWPSGDGASLTKRQSPQVRVLPGVLRSGLEPGCQHGLISRSTPVQIRPPQLDGRVRK